MHDRRNFCWKLNWYRQSELEGALLLGKLVRQAREPYLVHQLTKHCADEARHAWLWARTIVRLGLPTLRIHRSYQSFYLDEIGPPRNMTEVLALTHVFEQRVHRQFTEELGKAGLPEEARRTFSAMLRDEKGHLDWIARWLAARRDAEAMLRRYREADERVYRRLAVYRDRIWDIAGLGSACDGEDIDDLLAQEPHAAEPQHSTHAAA
jgi:bacterioferritin (cytochrome b1)